MKSVQRSDVLLIAVVLLHMLSASVFAAVPSVTVSIKRPPAPTNFTPSPIENPPIAFLQLIVDVRTTSGVAPTQLRIERSPDCLSTAPCTISGLPSTAGNKTSFTPFGAASGGSKDEVEVTLKEIIEQPSASTAVYRYWLLFNLRTNYDAGTHEHTMTADESWNVSFRSTTTTLNLEAACPISTYWNKPGGSPATGTFFLTGTVNQTGTEPVRVLDASGTPWAQACANLRPGIDAVLVLDKSGSMGWSTGSTRPRIEVLRDAVEDFVETWKSLRTSEAGFSPPITNNDRVGIVFFDHDASQWSGLLAPLNDFDPNRCKIAGGPAGGPYACPTPFPISGEPDPIDSVAPGGSTSIGDGLLQASSLLSGGTAQRKVVLLMSDGMQNTDALVGINPTATVACPAGVVYTHTWADATCTAALPGARQPNSISGYQIYSVTIGPSTIVQPQINENIARATRGFYINGEEDDELLRPFFLELLQNFLRFNSIETVRNISGNVTVGKPYEIEIPVTSSTTSLIVSVMTDRRYGLLDLSLRSPDGKQYVSVQGSGALRIDNPWERTEGKVERTGIWKASVELYKPDGEVKAAPIHLVALADDVALRSEQKVVSAEHIPGKGIRIQSQVMEFGKPITGLGSQPGAAVVARLIQPGEPLGDLLSTSTASTQPPLTQDTWSAADARLYNALGQNAKFLGLDHSGSVQLYDDGNPNHGDDRAGDGIYSAIYPVTKAGHYTFAFAVKGSATLVGEFSRQHTESVYVKSIPDDKNTEITTDIGRTSEGNVLKVIFTPKTKYGHRMGPGWRNYFWLTQPGRTPVRATDNNNGTYTAVLGFSGSTPPPVALHFVNAPVVLMDEITADKLPVPLGKETVIVPDVRLPTSACGCFAFKCWKERIFK